VGDAKGANRQFLATPLYQNRAWFGLVKTMLMQYAMTTAIILWMLVVVGQTTGNRTGQTATKKTDKKHTRTNKSWIRMRIRDYMNGIENVVWQLGNTEWDDVGKYTASNRGVDLKASTSFWVHSIVVLNAMRDLWSDLSTMNGWVTSVDTSVLNDIDTMIRELNDRTLTKAELTAIDTERNDLVAQMKAIQQQMDALNGIGTDKGDAPK